MVLRLPTAGRSPVSAEYTAPLVNQRSPPQVDFGLLEVAPILLVDEHQVDIILDGELVVHGPVGSVGRQCDAPGSGKTCSCQGRVSMRNVRDSVRATTPLSDSPCWLAQRTRGARMNMPHTVMWGTPPPLTGQSPARRETDREQPKIPFVRPLHPPCRAYGVSAG